MTTNLATHARRELELSGQYDEDPAYSESIIAAVEAFASYYGHSGGSAMVAREQLHRLLNWETLSPLTSDADEWMDVSEASGVPMWQSRRNPAAFSKDGGETWWVLDAEGDRKEEPQLSKLSYWTRRVGLDRYADALNPFSRLSWPIRLRLLLMVPWRSGWNARIRDWTARLEGHASYEDETTEKPPSDPWDSNRASAVRFVASAPGSIQRRICDGWRPVMPEGHEPPFWNRDGYPTEPMIKAEVAWFNGFDGRDSDSAPDLATNP